ncbi:WD40 repeat domain-containing protein [Paludisphaera borealis]|nr:WD40 repeat domain-containing protein [Paludisphaera borealis]
MDRFDDSGSTEAAGRIRSGGVRLSLMSREALAVVVGVLVVGVLVVALTDGEPGVPGAQAIESAHDDLLESLVVASDQQTLISCGRDDTVRFWDLRSGPSSWGREIERLPHGSHPFALAPSPDRRFLAVGGLNDLAVWERGERAWTLVYTKQGGDYRGLAFAADSRTLAIGTPEGAVRIVDAPSMREIATLQGFQDRIHSVAFSADGETLGAVNFTGEFKLWNWKTGRELTSLAAKIGPVHCFAFTADGRSVAVSPWGFGSGGPTLWDLQTGALRRRFLGQPDGVNRLVLSPDGRFLATATMNQTVKVWNVETGAVEAVLDEKLGWVKTLAFTEDGARIAYGGRDGSIHFWNFAEARGDDRPTTIQADPAVERTARSSVPAPEGLDDGGLKSVQIAWSSASGLGKPHRVSSRSRSGSPVSKFFSEDFAARSERIGD